MKRIFTTHLKEIVYGGLDGIVTTFAVVAGFAGATSHSIDIVYPVSVVLLFGFANLFADATSMGLGDFLSGRSEKKLYDHQFADQLHSINTHPQDCENKLLNIFIQKGFCDDDARSLVMLYKKNPSFFAECIMQYDVKTPLPDNQNPLHNGFFTFISFIIFGGIPLLPYIFGWGSGNMSFVFACLGSIFSLILLGILRSKVTQEILYRSTIEVVFIGILAGSVAYIVGTIF